MKQPEFKFPNGARAALSIIDDADEGNLENLEPIYDLLNRYNLRTTKSVWVFPSRRNDGSHSLHDPQYLEWLLRIKQQGFEISLHNVGDGLFVRSEIKKGLEIFRRTFGLSPRIHCNHSSNPDNVYWSARERFGWPVSWAYRIGGNDLRTVYGGSDPNSPFYWADLLAKEITYVRNLVFNDINTLKMDPAMPYWDARRPLVPFWFSSTDMRDIHHFSQVLTAERLDRLCNERGVCIGYTHFGTKGFLDSTGRPALELEKPIKRIAERDIWVAPASTILDFLLQRARYHSSELRLLHARALSIRWVMDRLSG